MTIMSLTWKNANISTKSTTRTRAQKWMVPLTSVKKKDVLKTV